MKSSTSIASLAVALAAAQGEIRTIGYDSDNPHFKSRFASLAKITETVRPILAKHGLSVIQGGYGDLDVQPGVFGVETTLIHSSGEWLSTFIEIPLAKRDPQGAGSGVTYGRRYGLAAILSLATDEDDDGNSATRPERPATPVKESKRVQSPPHESTPSARVVGAIDRLPNWPAPYAFAGVPLRDAPKDELLRLVDWQPKDEAKYAPLKDAIVLELERRREDIDDPTKLHPELEERNDELPF